MKYRNSGIGFSQPFPHTIIDDYLSIEQVRQINADFPTEFHGNWRWWHLMTPPEHLTFFSRTGLARMVGRCGLSVEHVSHRPVVANVGYIADKLAGVVGRPLGWLPRCVGALGLRGVDLDVNVLDVVTFVARRI